LLGRQPPRSPSRRASPCTHLRQDECNPPVRQSEYLRRRKIRPSVHDHDARSVIFAVAFVVRYAASGLQARASPFLAPLPTPLSKGVLVLAFGRATVTSLTSNCNKVHNELAYIQGAHTPPWRPWTYSPSPGPHLPVGQFATPRFSCSMRYATMAREARPETLSI